MMTQDTSRVKNEYFEVHPLKSKEHQPQHLE